MLEILITYQHFRNIWIGENRNIHRIWITSFKSTVCGALDLSVLWRLSERVVRVRARTSDCIFNMEMALSSAYFYRKEISTLIKLYCIESNYTCGGYGVPTCLMPLIMGLEPWPLDRVPYCKWTNTKLIHQTYVPLFICSDTMPS